MLDLGAQMKAGDQRSSSKFSSPAPEPPERRAEDGHRGLAVDRGSPGATLVCYLPGVQATALKPVGLFEVDLAPGRATRGLTAAGLRGWAHLQKHTSASLESDEQSPWEPLIGRVNDVAFILDGDPQAVMDLRESEASESIRRTFRKMMALAATDSRGPKKKHAKELAAELHQGIKNMRKTFRVAEAPHTARFTGRVDISIPKGGFERNTIRRLLITFGRTKNAPAVPIALHVKLEVAA